MQWAEKGVTIKIFSYKNIFVIIKVGHLSIKTSMFDFEARVLIGWLANIMTEPANQDMCLKIKHFFPAHKFFAKKAVERVRSEKNILNR